MSSQIEAYETKQSNQERCRDSAGGGVAQVRGGRDDACLPFRDSLPAARIPIRSNQRIRAPLGRNRTVRARACCGAAVLRCCGAAVLRGRVASCLHGHAHVCGVGRACMVHVRGGVCLRLRSHLAEEIASRGGRLEVICRGHLKRPGHREARRAADRARSRQVAADRARCGRARRARA